MRFTFLGLRIQLDWINAIKRRRILPVPTQPIPPTSEASDDFWNAFSWGTTLVATCRCGRTHFSTDTSLDYDDGELQRLLAQEKEDPERYRSDAINSAIALIDGPNGLMVWGCSCHSAKPFENFLVDNRREILDYYRRCDSKLAATLSANLSEIAALAHE